MNIDNVKNRDTVLENKNVPSFISFRTGVENVEVVRYLCPNFRKYDNDSHLPLVNRIMHMLHIIENIEVNDPHRN